MWISGGIMEDLNMIWDEIKSIIRLNTNELQFNTWIKPLVPIKIEDDSLYLNATTNFIKKIVVEKYCDMIEEYLSFLMDKKMKVVVVEPGQNDFNFIMNKVKIKSDGQVSLNYEGEIEEKKEIQKQKEELNKKINKNNVNNSLKYLNPRYTFDNFVKGKSNEFALAVATAVSQNPGVEFNPLFIYGGSGLGKTHLMQAIGHEILKTKPETKVLYITSENFMNEFISTITDKTNSVTSSQAFRNKYRNADVLMIDDIQFIAGKEGTQEELFHTFNALREVKKQIILTSDKPPKEIKNLEERLVTRFEGGMLVDIQLPDYETRVAILNHKIQADKIEVPNNVVEFIASNITSNIRELEGAIIKVVAFYNIKKGSRDYISDEEYLEIAKEALSIEEQRAKPVTLELIKEVVTAHYKLNDGDLVSKSRQKNIALPRQIAMHLSRQMTDLSLVKIANSFDRDHTTVMHGDEKIEKMKLEDEEFKKEIEELSEKIKKQ